MKISNIHILQIPEGAEKQKGTENIFKAIMATKFQNQGREIEISSHMQLV